MTEIWKDVADRIGIYQVSDMGRIKSLSRLTPGGIHKHILRKEKILSPSVDSHGYYQVDNKLLHRIVAKTFIPNPENKPCVNHINGIKTDNRIENLEWITFRDNSLHAYNNGLKIGMKKEKNPMFGKKRTLKWRKNHSKFMTGINNPMHKKMLNNLHSQQQEDENS